MHNDKLKISKEKSTEKSAKRVTKKKILETAFEVETSLKKKLIDTTPLVTNDEINNSQQSSEDWNKTAGSKQGHTGNGNYVDNSTKNPKKKKIQTSLSAFFKMWINILMLNILLQIIFFVQNLRQFSCTKHQHKKFNSIRWFNIFS